MTAGARAAGAASAIFAALSRDIDQLDKPERTRMMKGLGKTMGEMYFELICPIGKQYPILNPALNDDTRGITTAGDANVTPQRPR